MDFFTGNLKSFIQKYGLLFNVHGSNQRVHDEIQMTNEKNRVIRIIRKGFLFMTER